VVIIRSWCCGHEPYLCAITVDLLMAETGDDAQELSKTFTSCKEQSALRCSHIGYVNDKQPAYNQGGYG